MVNKYLKALALTVILLAIGIWLMNYLDSQRFESISSGLEEVSLGSDQAQQLLFYESIFGNSQDICPALSGLIDLQVEKTRSVLGKFQGMQASNLLANTELLKLRYLNENVSLYLYLAKYRKDCGDKGTEPILYFYTDKSYNPDEAAEQKVLDGIVQQCHNIKVFAFPHDLGIPVVSVLLSKYSVSTYPSIVIGGEKLSGVVSKDELLGKVQCVHNPT